MAVALRASPWIARVRQRALRRAPEDRDAVVLRHSRIYVLPTRRGLAVIGTLATMLLTSLNYGLSLGFVVTFVLAGLAGAALLHTFRNLAGLEIRPGSAAETFAGAPVAFTLMLAGRGADRAALRVRLDGQPGVEVEVPADARALATLEVPSSRRGRVPLGRVTVTSDYPLGLWRAWSYVHFPLAGLAFPAPESGAPPVPGSRDGDDADSGVRGDDADLAGLREYQPGDPIQRVAWKAVARGGGWFTKEFEGSRGGGAASIDWAVLPAALDVEARLSRLCAWVLACERAMRPYTLRIPGAALPPGLGREQRRAALTALALYEGGAR